MFDYKLQIPDNVQTCVRERRSNIKIEGEDYNTVLCVGQIAFLLTNLTEKELIL